MNREHERGFHVTTLVYQCDRRVYYSLTSEPSFSAQTILKMAAGTALHESVRLPNTTHEIRLSAEGVSGAIDSYDVKSGDVVDIKLTWVSGDLAQKLPFEHHVTQLRFYAWLLWRNNLPVGKLHLFYAPLDRKFEVERPDFEKFDVEVKERVALLKECLARQTPPTTTYQGEECNFCGFKRLCKSDNRELDRLTDPRTISEIHCYRCENFRTSECGLKDSREPCDPGCKFFEPSGMRGN
jgi:CRISPR-associated protein Cas4